MQRAALRAKGMHPDILVMTATPIPRTLALTTYGDLDVSVMREMPPGRKPIKTIAKPETRRDEIYDFMRKEIDPGRQAYVIYPLVEESAKIDLRAATEMADHLQQDVFPAVSRRPPARAHEAGGQGSGDARLRARRVSTSSSRRPSSKSASTCRTRR